MKQDEILILKLNSYGMFNKYINSDEFQNTYFKPLNKIPFLLKIFRKLGMDWLFYGRWKKHIKNYKLIIIFDTGYTSTLTKYIKNKYKKCTIIFYYWNIVNDYNKKVLCDKNIDEIWTFDEKDAKRYQLKWNPQFFTNKIYVKKRKINYSVVFLGREKGRKEEIDKVAKIFKDNELHYKMIVIENERDLIEYDDYLDLVFESKSILDILAPGQSGMTLRCMESLFFEKKLITNNVEIINCSFYNKNNIFILGKDSLDNLKEFLDSPYVKIDENIRDYYDYNQWLERFLEKR